MSVLFLCYGTGTISQLIAIYGKCRAAVAIFNRRKLKNRHELLVAVKKAWGREGPQSKDKLKKIEGWVW